MTKFNGMISSKHVTYSNAVSFTPSIYNNDVFIFGNAINSNASVVLVIYDSEMDVSEDSVSNYGEMNVSEHSTINENEMYISADLQDSESDMDDDNNSEDLCSKRDRPIRP